MADLFNPACSPLPGTAARTFFLPKRLATFQTPQPSTALRRLMIPIQVSFPVRAYQGRPFQNGARNPRIRSLSGRTCPRPAPGSCRPRTPGPLLPAAATVTRALLGLLRMPWRPGVERSRQLLSLRLHGAIRWRRGRGAHTGLSHLEVAGGDACIARVVRLLVPASADVLLELLLLRLPGGGLMVRLGGLGPLRSASV